MHSGKVGLLGFGENAQPLQLQLIEKSQIILKYNLPACPFNSYKKHPIMGAAASVEGENNETHDPNEDYVVEPPSCKCCNSS